MVGSTDTDTWKSMAKQVEWYEEKENEWKDYDDIMSFSESDGSPQHSPEGQLPLLPYTRSISDIWGWDILGWVNWGLGSLSLFSRIKT